MSLRLAALLTLSILFMGGLPACAGCPLEERLKAAGLVDAALEIPGLEVELVYATPNNVFGKPMFDYLERVYLRPETVHKLTRAQELLQKRRPGDSLKILDAARPRSVQ